jgi:hypothetical protein
MRAIALVLLVAFPVYAQGIDETPAGFWDTPRALSMPDGAVVAPLTPTGDIERMVKVPAGAYVNDKALALLAEKTKPVNVKAIIVLSFVAGIVSGAAATAGAYALLKH